MGNLTATAYAISAYDALTEIGKISIQRRNTMIALRGSIHVACFHHHVFVWAFADASVKTW